jgi:DNA-binding MarR family transcriptional regulator
MLLRHHSAVGLIDRLEAQGYVRRHPNPHDERSVLVQLLPRGRRALECVVSHRLHELRETGDSLAAAIVEILKASRAKHRLVRQPRNPRRKPAVRFLRASRK